MIATTMRHPCHSARNCSSASKRSISGISRAAYCFKAAQRYPDYAEIYKLLGLDYALGGALREAETAFRKAVQLAPESWEHYYFLGRTVFELGRVDEALPVLQRAVKLNDASVKAWTALGQVQERVATDAAAEDSVSQGGVSAVGGWHIDTGSADAVGTIE